MELYKRLNEEEMRRRLSEHMEIRKKFSDKLNELILTENISYDDALSVLRNTQLTLEEKMRENVITQIPFVNRLKST